MPAEMFTGPSGSREALADTGDDRKKVNDALKAANVLGASSLKPHLQALREKGLMLQSVSPDEATHLIVVFNGKRPGKLMSQFPGPAEGLTVDPYAKTKTLRVISGSPEAIQAYVNGYLNPRAAELELEMGYAKVEKIPHQPTDIMDMPPPPVGSDSAPDAPETSIITSLKNEYELPPQTRRMLSIVPRRDKEEGITVEWLEENFRHEGIEYEHGFKIPQAGGFYISSPPITNQPASNSGLRSREASRWYTSPIYQAVQIGEGPDARVICVKTNFELDENGEIQFDGCKPEYGTNAARIHGPSHANELAMDFNSDKEAGAFKETCSKMAKILGITIVFDPEKPDQVIMRVDKTEQFYTSTWALLNQVWERGLKGAEAAGLSDFQFQRRGKKEEG